MSDQRRVNKKKSSNIQIIEEDKQTITVLKNGKVLGKIAKFNNGITKDGFPIPLE